MPKIKKDVKLITLDTETFGLAGAIRRIAIYDGEQVHYGYKFSDIEPILLDYAQYNDVHIYIHNLDFDARKIPEIFRPGNVRWNNCLCINRKYATIACEHYTIHDSFKLLPMSLDKLSKDFNLEHGKLDLWTAIEERYPGQYKDKGDFFNRCSADDELYLEYLGYDVISLYELIMKLCEVSTIPLYEMVNRPSTASISKFILKHGYNGQKFISEGRTKTDFELLTKNKYWRGNSKLKGTDVSFIELENKIREGYYGGRTEVFKPELETTGTIAGYHYDVNSLYPFVCLQDFPIGVPEYYTKPHQISYQWKYWLRHHKGLGFIKCKLFVPKQHIPPLPSRKNKLCFLCGYIEGTWTYNEIEYAVKNCGVKILEIEELIHFTDTFPVYRNFILTMYEIKEQATIDGNKALRTFAKLVMNTAYGWTCMSRDDKTGLDDIENKQKYIDSGRFIRADEELGFCEVVADVRTETIQVQIGAYVTSYARLLLLDALRKQAETGEVYYCDTDSIVCSTPLPDDWIHSTELGKWGLESILKQGLFLQPKVYSEVTFNNDEEFTNIKFKGITKQRQSELDFEFYQDLYKRLQNRQKGKFLVEKDVQRLPSLITAQKRGEDPNELKTIDKEINLENVQKRNVDYKNNISVAWFMPSFEYFRNFKFKFVPNWEGDFCERRR